MPQRRCCVPSCKSSEIEGAKLHSFPNPTLNLDKFRTWVNNAGLVGEDDLYVFLNRRICRLHFEEIYHYPKNRLSRIAVPTLCLPVSKNDTQEITSHDIRITNDSSTECNDIETSCNEVTLQDVAVQCEELSEGREKERYLKSANVLFGAFVAQELNAVSESRRKYIMREIRRLFDS